ncbi:MAG: hypothetical protein WD042_09585 [Phycisphaeraceae bacterium]
MNDRERFIAALRFEPVDRVPFNPGSGRKSTREAWYRQGLPADVKDYHGYIRELLGIAPAAKVARVEMPIDLRMIPQFEEKVIEHRPAPAGSSAPGSLIVQDWKGNICEISDEFDVSYLRNAIDFVTRSWIKCPVESREDWEAMKERYKVDDPARRPADLAQRGALMRDRPYIWALTCSGPFWQLREWLGFENLCMLFLDDPDFVRDMISFWQDFIAQMLQRVLKHVQPDFLYVSEDMAYKEKPMIGAAMSREFLLPCWKCWHEIITSAGVPLYNVDSDGHIGELLPVWIEAGFNVNEPIEVAAGNDLLAYQRTYGKRMAYHGGVDKRAIAKGGQALRDEIDRLKPAIQAGGFIPSCDHGVPADVSWPNFVEYNRLLAQATGWL